MTLRTSASRLALILDVVFAVETGFLAIAVASPSKLFACFFLAIPCLYFILTFILALKELSVAWIMRLLVSALSIAIAIDEIVTYPTRSGWFKEMVHRLILLQVVPFCLYIVLFLLPWPFSKARPE